NRPKVYKFKRRASPQCMDAILADDGNGSYCGTVLQAVTIDASRRSVWKEIGNIVGLPEWVTDVKKAEFLSKTRYGIGAARRLWFADGSIVDEYVTGWKEGQYLSYIATSGLPLRGYHATISITPRKNASYVLWSSFLISEKTDRKKFEEFLSFMESFYSGSLKNLKAKIEKQHN
ncbi:MAG TPA: SRPBCC family protein, partial [Candidatus Nitrosotenuis sp.]|nr:SRPBCC family protein [Candidatus Nitrosotenuis sp.]